MKSILFLLGAFSLIITIGSSQTICPQQAECQKPSCPTNYTFNGTTCVRFISTTPTYNTNLWGGNTQSSTPQVVTPSCP